MIAGVSESTAGRRAALWWLGQVLDLGTLPEGIQSEAHDINNLAQVVGSSTSTVTRPFLWQLGHMSELPMLHSGDPSWGARARSINDRGQIAGDESFPSANERVALLWEGGTVHDLNDRIDSTDPLAPFITFQVAWLINNRGDIIAQGFDSRAPNLRAGFYYLLTPLRQ